MVTQAEIKEKSGRPVIRCPECSGLIWQTPNSKGKGLEWRHVFAEDAIKCPLEPGKGNNR